MPRRRCGARRVGLADGTDAEGRDVPRRCSAEGGGRLLVRVSGSLPPVRHPRSLLEIPAALAAAAGTWQCDVSWALPQHPSEGVAAHPSRLGGCGFQYIRMVPGGESRLPLGVLPSFQVQRPSAEGRCIVRVVVRLIGRRTAPPSLTTWNHRSSLSGRAQPVWPHQQPHAHQGHARHASAASRRCRGSVRVGKGGGRRGWLPHPPGRRLGALCLG